MYNGMNASNLLVMGRAASCRPSERLKLFIMH